MDAENKMLKYDNVVWDWNGTIVDDTHLYYEIYERVANKYKLKDLSYNQYLDEFQFPLKEFWRKVGLKDEDLQDVREFTETWYIAHWCNLTTYGGIRQLIKFVKEKGGRNYILSQYKKIPLNTMVDYLGIRNDASGDENFTAIIGVDPITGSKTEAGEKILNGFPGFKDKPTVMIGDTLADACCANILQWDYILVSWGTQSKKSLLEGSIPILNGMPFKVKEDKIVNNIKQLQQKLEVEV